MSVAEAVVRAKRLAAEMKSAGDMDARRLIECEDFPASAYSDRPGIGINEDAWNRVLEIGEEPKMIFAHPDMLCRHPTTSLHYRGISTLPFKRVRNIIGVDAKKTEGGASLSGENGAKLACLYNTVISTIILDSDDWTAQNGYRNILATLGISKDGVLRTMVGIDGETKVRRIILDWLDGSGIGCSEVDENKVYDLRGAGREIRMSFSSEPDVKFEAVKNGGFEIVSTVEIKAGTDPAGALERLGAIRKSFEHTPVHSRNFAVLGVITSEMEARLKEMHIAKYFRMSDLEGSGKEGFLNEIFHYTLRLT